MDLQRLTSWYLQVIKQFPALHRVVRPVTRLFRPQEGERRTIPTGPAAGLCWVFRRQYDLHQGYGTYEPHVQQALARWLGVGDVLVDVGGYAGFFALLGAKLVGPSGHVYCFEPLPNNRAMCEENFQTNGLTNVELHPVALSDHDGEGVFEFDGNTSTAKFSSASHAPAEKLTVRVARLDSYAIPRASLMKIDVEGFAGSVLQGARETLLRSPACRVIVEIHGMDELAAVRRALEGLELHLHQMTGEPLDEDRLRQSLCESHTQHIVLARAW